MEISDTIIFIMPADDVSLKYPFFYRPEFEVLENGWDAYQPEREFSRIKEISDDWRLSYVNKDFSVSSSTFFYQLRNKMWIYTFFVAIFPFVSIVNMVACCHDSVILILFFVY